MQGGEITQSELVVRTLTATFQFLPFREDKIIPYNRGFVNSRWSKYSLVLAFCLYTMR